MEPGEVLSLTQVVFRHVSTSGRAVVIGMYLRGTSLVVDTHVGVPPTLTLLQCSNVRVGPGGQALAPSGRLWSTGTLAASLARFLAPGGPRGKTAPDPRSKRSFCTAAKLKSGDFTSAICTIRLHAVLYSSDR
jgi:hypothetical protein